MANSLFEEEFGIVSLSEKQVNLLLKVVLGKEAMGNHGSTRSEIERKIMSKTGWEEMRFTQMCCRFAYKHGMVRL